MLRLALSISSMLAACAPSPQKAAMPSPSPASGTIAQPDPLADSPAETRGRRVLSTAFVRVGPDRHLTVELRDGRVLLLRDVAMRPTDFCGVQVGGDPARAKYCGGYAEVAAAWPGGAAAPDQPNRSAPNPAEPARGPDETK